MGDLAEALASLPSRLTRQVRRLEGQGLVRREASQADRRGVNATITDDGRTAVRQAMVTYCRAVRAYFLGSVVPLADRRDGGELPSDQRRAEDRSALTRLERANLVRGGVAERPNALALKARDG